MDYLISNDKLCFVLMPQLISAENAIIICEYLAVHSSAGEFEVVSSPSGENFELDLREWRKTNPTEYIGDIKIKCSILT
jgi:hypothetical protein